MNKFLNYIADKVNDSIEDLSNLKLILPSNRASLFLRNILIRKIKKPTFSPSIISISDFIEELSEIKRVSKTSAIFEMYVTYCENISKKEQENFDDFMGWANILINDFNLIDNYLVDPKAIFSNMLSTKEIEDWGALNDIKGSNKNIKFWKKIPKIYSSFSKSLIKKGFGTSGIQSREAIKNLELYMSENFKPHYFIGFNMLNKAESTIIQEFISQNKGKVFWDLDHEFYYDDKNTAGKHIRSYYKEWSCLIDKKPEGLSKYYEKEKNFHIIETSNKISQVKYAGQIINGWKIEGQVPKKGVIVGDEETLPALLSGIDIDTKDWNVTMGIPIKNSEFQGVINSIFEMHINASNKKFFYEDILSVLTNTLIKKQFENEKINLRDKIKKLKKSNYTLFKSNQLYTQKKSFEYILFKSIDSASDFILKVNKVLKYFEKDNYKIKNDLITSNDLNKIKDILSKLLTYTEKITDFSLDVLFHIYKKSLEEEKLNFSGDYDSKIQITSLSETKLIDFDTVILTNVNEGILPSGRSGESFLPFDIKKHYDLPTFFDYDARETYQFYQLIQNAKEIYLLYSNSEKGLGGLEKSRFIHQLINFNKPNHKINFIKTSNLFEDEAKFEIKKTTKMVDLIKAKVKEGISPSTLSKFLTDPMSFYFDYVLGIENEKEYSNIVEATDKGNIAHETLKKLYDPYVSRYVNKNDYDEILFRLPIVLNEEFIECYGGNPERTGYNYLIYEEIKKQCKEFLLLEKELIHKGNSLKIIALEEEFKYNMHIEGLPSKIKLYGFIDRIDEWNGQIRISDYKTGTVKKDKLKFFSDFAFDNSNKKKNSDHRSLFQLLVYSYVYFKQNSSINKIKAGIIPLKTPKDYFYPITRSKEKNNNDFLLTENFIHFEQELLTIFKYLFDEKLPLFTEDSE